MIACYTAIAGGYDNLLPCPEVDGVDFIAFVRDMEIADPVGWDVRPLHPSGVGHPRMDAKLMKVLGPQMAVLSDYEATVWIDGSHFIKKPEFVAEAVACLDAEHPIAMHTHPWRDCIYDEAAVSIPQLKYAGLPLQAQVDAYRADGFPEHAGLWAAGTIARRPSPVLNLAMREWWDEMVAWTYQDQLSLPVVLRRHEIACAAFPHHQVFDSPWIDIRGHLAET